VKVGREAEPKLARIRLIGLLANTSAGLQIVINCLFKRSAKLGNALPMKTNHILNTRNPANETAIFIAVLNSG
jgi:hypothetical protein